MGWVLISLGVLVVLVNYVDVTGAELLPGGHGEGYFLLGLLIGGVGTWFTSLFDSP